MPPEPTTQSTTPSTTQSTTQAERHKQRYEKKYKLKGLVPREGSGLKHARDVMRKAGEHLLKEADSLPSDDAIAKATIRATLRTAPADGSQVFNVGPLTVNLQTRA